MPDPSMNAGRLRGQLAPSEKCELLWVAVLTGSHLAGHSAGSGRLRKGYKT